MRSYFPVLVGVLALSAAASAVLSNFDDGTFDGWTVFGDSDINNSINSAAPILPPSGMLDDGYLWGRDTTGGTRIFNAPDKFHGNFYGQTLSFDYLVGSSQPASATLNSDLSHIRVTDGTNTLVINLSTGSPWPNLGQWYQLSVVLDESETQGSGWYLLTGANFNSNGGNVFTNGRAATDAEIQCVFSNIQGIRLGSEVIGNQTSEEYIGIDNVQIVPEPLTAVLFGAGALLMARKTRRG